VNLRLLLSILHSQHNALRVAHKKQQQPATISAHCAGTGGAFSWQTAAHNRVRPTSILTRPAALLFSAGLDLYLQLFGYDGYYEGELAHNGLVIEPQVLTCPDGEYVVQVRAHLMIKLDDLCLHLTTYTLVVYCSGSL
jgi:hypothetical protein